MAKKKPVYEVKIDRQKAAQAAGTYDLADLPGGLSRPVCGIRVDKKAKDDTVVAGKIETVDKVTQLYPGAALAIFGKSESRWAQEYDHSRGGDTTMAELLSYARQLIGMTPEGGLVVCLCGHPGKGKAIPLWAPQEELSLTVQPNDLVLRFDNVVPPTEA